MNRKSILASTFIVMCFFDDGAATAQVFVPQPNADTGEVREGAGEALYGNFGLNAATNLERSYSLYRKLAGTGRGETGPEIHTLTPVPGNSTAALWEGVDHGGSGTQSGFHDPGMFIGNSPSASTYPDQLIYFGATRNGTTVDDPDGGVGGDNLPSGTTESDSNDRVNWEVAVAFLEDPDGFVDGRSPNTEAWDLWSGDWGSDGVSMRLFFSATDSSEIGNSDWFSFNETPGGQQGDVMVPGMKAQSGSRDSAIGGETAREMIQTGRRFVGSGREIAEGDGDFAAGGGDGQAVHIGVSYDDKMELSWKMELSDPTNANPVEARKVRFSAKTGNLEYFAVFDPGAPGDGAEPNPLTDPGVQYTDGFFDWRNATPVFYLGLDNGTDYGENGASGLMGVFLPGDFNASGTVNDADRAILESFLGRTDTSYSRGDLDQDGDTDAADLAAWQALPPDGGGMVAPSLRAGDADQDLDFDQLDLVRVQIAAKYLTGQAATWGEGDWNGAPGGKQGEPPLGNGFFDQLDIIAALAPGHYLMGPYAALSGLGSPGDGQTSIIYNPSTGELAVDAPAGRELTSINIDSAAGIFTGDPAQNLGGSFDNDKDTNIFKATFGSSFGSLSFGNVAQTGLSQELVLSDLSVVGSLAGGGGLGDVDLIYVPEPNSMLLFALAAVGLYRMRRRR
jgi:hypothetical protein